MELKAGLAEIGLEDKQIEVYLAALQFGVATVLGIAKVAGVKRPTTYLILEQLEGMGLVSRVQKGRKVLYKAEEPDRLLSRLVVKQRIAEDLLPSLKAIYNLEPEKPVIKMNDGMAGVRNVYTEIFTYLANHPDEELLIFGSLKDAVEHFEPQVIDFFYQSIGRAKTRVREIGNDDHETRKYYRASARLNHNHDIRLVRAEGRFTQTDNLLYGNRLAIFSVKEPLFVTTIESAPIVETYRTIFNMAWRSGKSI